MKHLRLSLFLLLLIVNHAVWATPRTFKQAQDIAERQAKLMGISISQEARARSFNHASLPITYADATISTGTTAFYLFPYGENQGYTIISGDDQMPEIVAYSDKGTLDENHISEGCREFLQAYKQMVEAITRGDDNALKQLGKKRNLMASQDYQQPTVAPLLGDIAWNQGTPYNNMCPYDKDMQGRCVTGCVATAMAQVMMYWKYPEALVEDIPAYFSSKKYQIPEMKKGEKYDWDNMLPTYGYDESSYTQQQADAVAKLMLHCGAAMKMQYDVSGSAAAISTKALVKYFGYDPDLIASVNRETVGFKQWCQLIDTELLAKRPVLYSGQSSNGGHQYICDGADGNGLYHINWGWGGASDGYFDISILNPDYRGAGAGTGTGGYNAYCSIVIGLQPDNGQEDEPLIKLGDINVVKGNRVLNINKSTRTSAADNFEFSYACAYGNMQQKIFNGKLTVGIKEADGSYKPLTQNNEDYKILASPDDGRYYYNQLNFNNIEYAFPVGVTTLYDIYSTDNGKTWQKCNYSDGKPYELIATENTLSIVDETELLKTTLHAEDELMAKQNGYFNYTIKNENLHDYFGVIYIYTSQAASEKPDIPDMVDYVDIEAGGSTTHSFKLRPETSGNYYLWIYDKNSDKMLVDAQKFTVQEYEAPQLKLLSKSINLLENVYEKENGYLYQHYVKMPVVDGNEAVVKYEFQNDGGTYRADIPLNVYAYSPGKKNFYTRFTKRHRIEGKGGKTELEYRFNSSELAGYSSFICSLELDPMDVGEVDYSDIPQINISWLDTPGYIYYFLETNLVGHFRDETSGISMIPTSKNGLQVSVSKSSLTITADKSQNVTIHNLAGQCIRRLFVQAGCPNTVSLPSGIYVVGKKKIIVR